MMVAPRPGSSPAWRAFEARRAAAEAARRYEADRPRREAEAAARAAAEAQERQRREARWQFAAAHVGKRWAVEASAPGMGVADIIEATAEHYGVTPAAIMSESQSRGPLMRARHMAMFLARELTPRSTAEIGRQFGGRDHTTIIHGARKIESALRDDPNLCCTVLAIVAELLGSVDAARDFLVTRGLA